MTGGADQQPKTKYLVKISFFAGMTMEGVYKGYNITDIMKHPDISGKLGVTDSLKIERIGIEE